MKLNSLMQQWRDAQGQSADRQRVVAETILKLEKAEQKALATLFLAASPLMQPQTPEDIISFMTAAADKGKGPKPR